MIPVMIVPVLADVERLYGMLHSIDHGISRLVIIDNGRVVSELDVKQALVNNGQWYVESIDVLSMPSNLGVAGSWNLGIKCTPFAPWWLICNFDVTFPPGALADFDTQMSQCSGLMLSAGSPPWCMFGISDEAVMNVGLFDERFHPGYFEDDDMTRRCHAAGIPVLQSGVFVHHQNSSTLEAGFRDRNATTFAENQRLWLDKCNNNDLSEGYWSLRRRRVLTWD